MPLARESCHPKEADAERRLKGRDAEGSFQAGSLKDVRGSGIPGKESVSGKKGAPWKGGIPDRVGLHGLSPLQDRTLVEVAEAGDTPVSRCEQRWYRVKDALC